MKIIGVNLTEQVVAKLDKLIKEGYVPSRSEFVRTAVTEKIQSLEVGK